MRMRSKLALGSRALPTRQVILPLAKQALCCCAFCHRSWHRTPTANIHLVRSLHPPPRPAPHQRCDATMRCDACPIDLDPSPMICVRGGAGNADRRQQRQFSQLLQRAYSRPTGRTSCRVGRLALCCTKSWRMVGMRSICDDNHVAIFSRVNLAPSSKRGRPARHGYPPSRTPAPAGQKNHHPRRPRLCNFAWLWRQPNCLGCFPHALALPRLLATPPSSLHTAHHMLLSGPRRQPVATWMPCIAFAPHAHVRARRCAASVGGSIEC